MRQRWYGVDRVGIEPNDEAWETASVLVGGCGAALGHCQMLPRRDKDNRAEASPKLGLPLGTPRLNIPLCDELSAS